MIKYLKSFGGFFKRNFIKVLSSTLLLIVLTYFYNLHNKNLLNKNNSKTPLNPIQNSSAVKSYKFGNKSKILLKLRRQFLIGVFHLVPTFKKKIINQYDVLKLSKEIKRIRKSSSESSNKSFDSIELMLWEDLKVYSISLYISTIYFLSLLCILLKIQLFVMGSSADPSCYSFKSIVEQETQLDNDFFLRLFEGTFSKILKTGINLFSKHILPIVNEETEKLDLYVNKYNETSKNNLCEIDLPTFSYLVKRIQTRIKFDDMKFLHSIIIPESSEIEQSVQNRNANMLLDKIWDIIESPAFNYVLEESLFSLIDYSLELLRLEVFHNSSQNKVLNNFGSVPLASLLPHLRKVSLNLMDVGDSISPDDNILPDSIKRASQGENLETLCNAIFNA